MRPLVWELPYAAGAAHEMAKKKKKKKMKRKEGSTLGPEALSLIVLRCELQEARDGHTLGGPGEKLPDQGSRSHPNAAAAQEEEKRTCFKPIGCPPAAQGLG